MFTSRAEHRLHLRCDNADERLTPLGREIGLVDEARWSRYEQTQRRLAALYALLDQERVGGRTLRERLQRPDEDGRKLAEAVPALAEFVDDDAVWRRGLVAVKYAGYIARQQRLIEQFRDLEDWPIPAEFDYDAVGQLRHEARERLSAVRPRNVGQASRVSGVHPADISVLLIELRARRRDASTRQC